MHLVAVGVGVFKLFADAYPLRNFALLKLHLDYFDQLQKKSFSANYQYITIVTVALH
jgi:hypothetical protein